MAQAVTNPVEHHLVAPAATDNQNSCPELLATGEDPANTVAVVKQRVSQAATEARLRVSEAYDQARRRVPERWRDIRQASGDFVRRTRRTAVQARNEHPLELLAAVGALAVVAGILLRFWRSSRYE
jgi:hypothetical protein